MFTLVFQGTSTCDGTQDDHLPTTENNGMDSRFCTFQDSLATVYFMLLGQIGPDETDGSTIGKVIYAIFMFIVVILLTNVLIAIVTDSYNHIKSSKAQQVFWYNKFAFISEVDAGAENLPKNKYYERFTEWSRKTWSDWIDFKNDDEKMEYLLHGLILLVSYFLVLLWLIVGLVSLGLLWPPQVRMFIFGYNAKEVTSTRVAKHSTNHLHERRTEEINGLKVEIFSLKEEIHSLKVERKIDRNSLKKDVEEIKELLRELNKD
mmetsp:Transcript_49568/g.74800  ORF Transcript_49568/g.74800 Transcript_49568/m.74800 type:complete len:262 (-) Transcript_49568:289-1074(-)